MRRHAVLGRIVPGSLLVCAAVASCAWGADPTRYEAGVDPRLGINIWDVTPHEEDLDRLVREVNAMKAAGFHEVTFIPLAFAQTNPLSPDYGRIQQYPAGTTIGTMSDGELSAGIARAKTLGMAVAVTPFINVFNQGGGRDAIDFTTATQAGQQFWSDYRARYTHWAQLANTAGADRFNVGSEMASMDHNPANASSWSQVIDDVDAVFSRDIGYTAQHWHFGEQAMMQMIWSNPKIDYISASAYLTNQPLHGKTGLASLTDAIGTNSDGAAFIGTVETNFGNWLVNELLPTADLAADGVVGGARKKVVIGEFGVPPFDTRSLDPWNWEWSPDPDSPLHLPYDALEARNTWEGVLRALDGRGAEIESIGAWLWGWEGGYPAERFMLRPGMANVDWTDLDETQTNLVSQYLSDYARGIPEPGTLSALGALLLLLNRRRNTANPARPPHC